MKLHPLSAHIKALTALQPWFEKHLKTPCEGVSRWVALCRKELEALTASEPAPPSDFRRDADVLPCKCADCAALRTFLHDPKESVYQFRAGQNRRSHLEHGISQHGCDASCTTERKGSPHTLICKKTTASFHARLKKYHEDLRHLATLREIETARVRLSRS